MDYNKITLDELKKGYRYDKEHDIYICNYCAQNFEVGQIYSISNNFYTAEHAVSKHIEITHGSNLSQLISADTKSERFNFAFCFWYIRYRNGKQIRCYESYNSTAPFYIS